MAIDYGTKKIGLAVTDPLQIIVTGLPTIAANELEGFLASYTAQEVVEEIVLGMPHHPDGQPAQLAPRIRKLGDQLALVYPDMRISYQDESYTSRDAKDIILRSGVSKSRRRDKLLVDKISAVLILQTYLKHF